jgi:hypothetical protein
MNKQQNRLLLLSDLLFISDGGLETTLSFHNKLELPMTVALPLASAE